MTTHDDAAQIERIARFLTREGQRFGLALVLHADRVLADEARERLRARMTAQGRRIATLELSYADEREDLAQRMLDASADADALFVVGLDRLATDAFGRPRQTAALANLNQSRDKLPDLLDVRVVFWVAKAADAALTDAAADFLQVMLSVIELDAAREPAALRCELAEPPPPWLELAAEAERPGLAEQLERFAGLFDAAEDPRSRADMAASAGDLALRIGQRARARDWLERAASSYVEAKQPREAAVQARRLAELALDSGSVELGETDAERALELAREANDPREQALARAILAELAGRRGELGQAIDEFEQAILPAVERESELAVRAREAHTIRIADLLARKGRPAEAQEILRAALIPGRPPSEAMLESFAAVQEAMGDLDAAAWLRRTARRPWCNPPRRLA